MGPHLFIAVRRLGSLLWVHANGLRQIELDAIARRLQGRVVVGKVDTDLESELSQSLRIRSIPTLILFRGGKEVARVSGAMSAAALERWVDQALTKAA
mgnify:CR=1 FL=1